MMKKIYVTPMMVIDDMNLCHCIMDASLPEGINLTASDKDDNNPNEWGVKEEDDDQQVWGSLW